MKLYIAGLLLVTGANALRIGFVGDTGAQTSGTYSGKAVYDMFQQENVDIVLQNGDLDYDRDPTKWDNFLNSYASGMDVLVTSGNHEEQFWYGRKWYGSNGYQRKMYERMSATLRSQCKGRNSLSEDYGEYMSCTVDNALFVSIGWAQMDSSNAVTFVEQELSNSVAPFKFCMWHRPEGKLNSGDTHTSNYGQQAVYEACRKHGAVITSGHSHVYGRSKLLSGFSGTTPLISSQDSENPTLSCGTTIAFVVGMGGYKFDGTGRYTSNFRKIHTEDTSSSNDAGALICDTGSGDQNTMDCFFKLTNGNVVESFTVTRAPADCNGSTSENGAGSRECADNVPSGLLHDDGREAYCYELANFCDRMDVSSACPLTCGRCGDACKDIGGLYYSDGGKAECVDLENYCDMEIVQESCAKTCKVCGTGETAPRSTTIDRFEFENVKLPFSVQPKRLPADISNPSPESNVPTSTMSPIMAAGIGAAVGGLGVAAIGAVVLKVRRNKSKDNVLEQFAC